MEWPRGLRQSLRTHYATAIINEATSLLYTSQGPLVSSMAARGVLGKGPGRKGENRWRGKMRRMAGGRVRGVQVYIILLYIFNFIGLVDAFL